MGIRSLFPLALILLLLAPAAGRAASSPPLRPFPHGHGVPEAGRPATDGLRYVVLNAAPGVVRLYDTDLKRTRDVTVRPECTMRGVTVNYALVGCSDNSVPYLLRLRTRELFPLFDEGPARSSDLQWYGIGRHWLLGGYHQNRPVTVYANWRNHDEPGGSFDGFEGPPHDLDARKLTAYSPSHTVFDSSGPLLMKDTIVRRTDPPQRRLLLDGGRRGRVVLSECRAPCWPGMLSETLATWGEDQDIVRAYDIRSGARFAWSVYDAAYFPRYIVGNTRRHVIIGQNSRTPPYLGRLLWARVRK